MPGYGYGKPKAMKKVVKKKKTKMSKKRKK
jgi:hypothetical protein